MMGNWGNFGPGGFGPIGFGAGILGFIVIMLWSLFWKGKALWHAARKGETTWFVVILVVNTVGILEILYLYVFSKEKPAPMVGDKQ